MSRPYESFGKRWLSPELIHQYDDEGFIILSEWLDPNKVEELRVEADEITGSVGPMIEGNPRLQLEMFEGAMRLRKVEPVIDISEPFRRAASDACLVGPVTELLGDKVVLFEDKLNFKYPQGGTGFSLHQDYAYWTRFSPRLCTALIYLDQATHENGCIELVPRRHKQGLFPCASQPVDQAAGQLSDLVIEDGALDLSSAVKATGNPGTVLLFNCLVPHCSKPNHTQKSRRAILYTYGPLSENTPYSYTDFEERYQGWLRGHQAASQPTA